VRIVLLVVLAILVVVRIVLLVVLAIRRRRRVRLETVNTENSAGPAPKAWPKPCKRAVCKGEVFWMKLATLDSGTAKTALPARLSASGTSMKTRAVVVVTVVTKTVVVEVVIG
jgi:hypothetical protein